MPLLGKLVRELEAALDVQARDAQLSNDDCPQTGLRNSQNLAVATLELISSGLSIWFFWCYPSLPLTSNGQPIDEDQSSVRMPVRKGE